MAIIAFLSTVCTIKLHCHDRGSEAFRFDNTIGPLGEPVGVIVDLVVKKTASSARKGAVPQVEVLSVNGKPTSGTVMKYEFFGGAIKTLEDDRRYKCTGYQSGRFSGIPSNLPKETIENYSYQASRFAFEFILVICNESELPRQL